MDHAAGLTPRSVLEKFAAMQMIDVHLPTTDSRELCSPAIPSPNPSSLLLNQLKLEAACPTTP